MTGCGSAWLERLVWDQEVAGSNPVTPIHNMREWLSWWSATLPRSRPRVRVPSRALNNKKKDIRNGYPFSCCSSPAGLERFEVSASLRSVEERTSAGRSFCLMFSVSLLKNTNKSTNYVLNRILLKNNNKFRNSKCINVCL